MVELKEEYPFKRDDGSLDYGLIRHYAVDENGEHFYIKQLETGVIYGEAIDIYPCPYTYVVAGYAEDVADKNVEDIEGESEDVI